MIQIQKKEECCGCNACEAICPKQCISKRTDEEGFWYPEVDLSACVDCGLCEKVCPILEKADFVARYEEPLVFAAYNKDHSIRMDSTSGGIFSALANHLFKEGGYVGGAIYNADHTVSHIVTNDARRLDEIRSSKYLQSDTDSLFKDVKALLRKGEKVLVCATPCQIQGLYNFLGKEYENLYTCDFICRGVNSPKVFLSYMDMLERQHGAKAEKIKFKAKQWGWHNFSMRVNFANGKEYCKDRWHDLFFIGYLQSGNFARPSCYTCCFKGFPQKADLTLADFWGIEALDPNLDQDCGTSLVMVNSDKGKRLFDSVEDTIVYKEFTMAQAAAGNPAMNAPLKARKSDRTAFFKAINTMTFEKVAKRFFPIPSLKTSLYKRMAKCKRMVRELLVLFCCRGFSCSAWGLFFYCNFMSRKVTTRSHQLFNNLKYCRVQLDSNAQLVLNSKLTMGLQQVKSSRRETRLLIEEGGQMCVNGAFTMFSDSYIRVIKGGTLLLNQGFINEGCQITCASRIEIGEGCVIARDVVIRDYDGHHVESPDYQISKPIFIGKHVWIGNRAMILKGVTIGDGAIISAGAIVTKDIPAHSVAAGVPAKLVKHDVYWY